MRGIEWWSCVLLLYALCMLCKRRHQLISLRFVELKLNNLILCFYFACYIDHASLELWWIIFLYREWPLLVSVREICADQTLVTDLLFVFQGNRMWLPTVCNHGSMNHRRPAEPQVTRVNKKISEEVMTCKEVFIDRHDIKVTRWQLLYSEKDRYSATVRATWGSAVSIQRMRKVNVKTEESTIVTDFCSFWFILEIYF